MTPEGKVKELVKRALKAAGAYYHMPVQNGMGAPTLDFIGCHKGTFIAVETKAPGKKPTPRQVLTIEAMRESGALVYVVDGPETLEPLVNMLVTLSRKALCDCS